MSVEFKTGDLLKTDIEYICHQVNCQGRMGSGIAKQIREKYPKVYDEYIDKCNNSKDKFLLLGQTQIIDIGNVKVCNLFSQYNYGYDGKRYTSYDAFWNCLHELKKVIPEGSKIGFPENIGCGLGGANWPVIRSMIWEVLGLENYEVYIYSLEDRV